MEAQHDRTPTSSRSTPRRRSSLPAETVTENADSPKRPRRLSDSDIQLRSRGRVDSRSSPAQDMDVDMLTPSKRDLFTNMIRRPFARLRSFLDFTEKNDTPQPESEDGQAPEASMPGGINTSGNGNEGAPGTPAKSAPKCQRSRTLSRSRSNSRVHLSMTSPKRQPDIREMLMPKKKEKAKSKTKRASPGDARKPAVGAGVAADAKCTPSSASKPAKAKSKKTLPATNGKGGVSTANGSGKTAKKSTPINGSGKNGQSQKKTQKDAVVPAVVSETCQRAKNESTEEISPRSPSNRKRRRSMSPAPKKFSPETLELLAPEPSTKKRRQSMPSMKQPRNAAATSSAPCSPQKKSKKPLTPEDPHEAFAHYMAEGDSPTEVLPGLWLGGFNAWYRGNCLLGSERGEVEHIPRDMFFSSHKISHVVSLGPYRPECETFPDLEEVEHLNIDDCTEGDDAPAQTLFGDFERLVMQLARWRLEDKNVFVHCRAGQSRSATIVLAYFTVVFNIPTHDALAHLYQMRPGPTGVCPGTQFLQVLVLWENSDACQRARSQYSEESGRTARLKKDIQFLAEGWQNVLTKDYEEYTKGMFSDIILPHVPQFVLDPRKHLLALLNMVLAL